MRGIMAGLRRKKLIEGSISSSVMARPGAKKMLPDVGALPTGIELRRYWGERLGSGISHRIFELLVAKYPDDLTKEEIAVALDIEATGSTMRGGLAALRKLDLIVSERGGGNRAAEELF